MISSELLYRPSCLPLEPVVLGLVESVFGALGEQVLVLVLVLDWEARRN